ncbi:MAG TPA: gamma-glutamyltransferase [Candidatus Binatia bacterium]|nr:gamma-glutamyltransferase [Candidatus Binatia bacterium]
MFTSRRAEGRIELRSERSVAMALHGMVATSQTLASSAALATMRAGGNAIDAAVTAAAVLGVVEPYNTGVGGDCFALVWSARDRELRGYNGSGRSPAAATLDDAARRGAGSGPLRGPLAITVPGAVDAWCALLERFGRRSLADALAPAIEYAEHGFPVSEIVSFEWRLAVRAGFLANEEARRAFAPGGEPPRAGEVVRLPALARSLRALAAGGRDVLYRGELARAIARTAADAGGWLALDDLAEHRGAWVDPISTDYRGRRLFELPPNGQGLAALIALAILAEHEVGAHPADSAEAFHLKIEAVKLALADRDRWVCDPEHAAVPVAELLAPATARRRAAAIDPRRASVAVPAEIGEPSRDTIYLTVADGEGNVVSLINSLFGAFGSGIVAGETGIALQNRGAGFSLEPGHPNALAPRKRPLHTIIPAMLFEDGRPRVSFGVMGGHVQSQAHVQVVTALVDHGLNVQEALDFPRFHAVDGTRVCLEREVPEAVRSGLAQRGHEIAEPMLALLRGGYGGGQAIALDPATGALWGASDRRKDGCAIGY